MTNLTPLRNFLSDPSNDLGANAWKLLDLVKTMRNKRFMDLGVRNGASSAIMSVEAKLVALILPTPGAVVGRMGVVAKEIAQFAALS